MPPPVYRHLVDRRTTQLATILTKLARVKESFWWTRTKERRTAVLELSLEKGGKPWGPDFKEGSLSFLDP